MYSKCIYYSFYHCISIPFQLFCITRAESVTKRGKTQNQAKSDNCGIQVKTVSCFLLFPRMKMRSEVVFSTNINIFTYLFANMYFQQTSTNINIFTYVFSDKPLFSTSLFSPKQLSQADLYWITSFQFIITGSVWGWRGCHFSRPAWPALSYILDKILWSPVYLPPYFHPGWSFRTSR